MTKEAQAQIRSEAFSDELFKIAAENVLGPDVDWDNLTPEQLEKVAFLRGLAKGLGRVAGGAVGAARSTGKYLGKKFKDVGAGGKQVVQGVKNVAGGVGKAGLGVLTGTAGIAGDVAKGGANLANKALKAGAKAGDKVLDTTKDVAEGVGAKLKEGKVRKGVGKFFGNAIKGVAKGVGNVAGGIAGAVGKGVRATGKYFKSVGDEAKAGFQQGNKALGPKASAPNALDKIKANAAAMAEAKKLKAA